MNDLNENRNRRVGDSLEEIHIVCHCDGEMRRYRVWGRRA